MKIVYALLCSAAIVTSCQDSEKPADTTQLLKSDTTFVAGPELPAKASEAIEQEPPVQQKQTSTTKKKTSTKSSEANSQRSNAGSNGTTAAASQPAAEAAPEKKGWSKTAKGAVIGGVVGAGTGAVVNKKNRVAGAVIGGVIGAGAGAVIGNEMDKKDGRH